MTTNTSDLLSRYNLRLSPHPLPQGRVMAGNPKIDLCFASFMLLYASIFAISISAGGYGLTDNSSPGSHNPSRIQKYAHQFFKAAFFLSGFAIVISSLGATYAICKSLQK